MAKKKSATKSKKKTATRSSAASKKKSTVSSARSKAAVSKKAAKKKTASKKTAAKKPSAKKTTAKKAVTKKATSKKTATKKAASKKTITKKAAKKTTVKKAVAKKPVAKKATAKKAVAKKTTKKAASKKPSMKKAPKKAASKASAKASKASKAAAKPKKKPAPKAKDERHTLTDARAAASGLAARAGLKLVRAHASSEPAEKTKVRKLKKSPLSAAQLEAYRVILLRKRSEVAGDVSAMESEAFGPSSGGAFPQHQADQGSDEYEQTLSLELADSQRKLLVEINEALVRIQAGTYGICALTGGPIGRNRLDATPWTKLSLEGAREQDRQNYFL